MAVDASGANLYVALIEANAVQVLAINGQATPILVTKIPVGAGPVHVGIANAAGLIYVANQYSNTVSVISKSSLKAIATVPVGSSPQGLAVSADGTRVFIANSMSSSISVLSVSTNQVVATWPALSGSGSIAISPDGTRA